ncbi:hypothetical protein [Jiella sp. M17.18]
MADTKREADAEVSPMEAQDTHQPGRKPGKQQDMPDEEGKRTKPTPDDKG